MKHVLREAQVPKTQVCAVVRGVVSRGCAVWVFSVSVRRVRRVVLPLRWVVRTALSGALCFPGAQKCVSRVVLPGAQCAPRVVRPGARLCVCVGVGSPNSSADVRGVTEFSTSAGVRGIAEFSDFYGMRMSLWKF